MSEKPTMRWGIVTTGLISSWFVEDLVLDRPDAPVHHIVQSIASRDLSKCKDFAAKHCPKSSPTFYDDYQSLYNDPEVDVVYIGTPHAFHKQNMLDAISAGKAVLCEKAFTINSRQAEDVFSAAKAANTYIHEAMWLRHRPLVHKLRQLLFHDKIIGDPFRTFSDFPLEIDIPNLPATSRYKDLSLGAGTLLDTGIYSLTWAILTLDAGSPGASEQPLALAVQSHLDGIEVTTSVLLQFPSTGRQGIITSTSRGNGTHRPVVTIEGTDGYIEVEGPTASLPLSFTVYPKLKGDPNGGEMKQDEPKRYDFEQIGRGFIYEADNTALDVLAGRKENAIMPWSETMHVMRLMDSIRKQGDTFYPGHDDDF